MGIKSQATDLLIDSISSATLRQYSRPLVDWATFCRSKGVDTFNPEMESIVAWLYDKFEHGASFSTLNMYRSALSLIIGEHVGKSSLISRLLKGVFHNRPQKPKYDRIYDLEPVLARLRELFPLENLNLADLTVKLVVLLALITAHRKQTIALIKVCNIKKTAEGFEIEIPERIKSSRPGAFQPLLILPGFPNNPELCAAKTLEKYLESTREIRGSCDELFLTTRAPFRKASKDTISRWIRSFLVRCGISEDFTPHSLRHASTSAALKKGIDISIIKKLAGWSEQSNVFNKFYNRPIVKSRLEYAEAVMLRE